MGWSEPYGGVVSGHIWNIWLLVLACQPLSPLCHRLPLILLTASPLFNLSPRMRPHVPYQSTYMHAEKHVEKIKGTATEWQGTAFLFYLAASPYRYQPQCGPINYKNNTPCKCVTVIRNAQNLFMHTSSVFVGQAVQSLTHALFYLVACPCNAEQDQANNTMFTAQTLQH